MNSPESEIGTLVRRIEHMEDVFNPNVVKAVIAENGRALYFSRNPVPFVRGVERENWLSQAVFYRHIGLYAYRPEVLLKITALPPGKLELAESLEQLRWMEADFKVYVRESLYDSIGIDTPEDLLKAKKHLSDLS